MNDTITRDRTTLRAELQASAPSAMTPWFGVYYRWTPTTAGSLTGGSWELLATSSQHELAQAIADLYGAISTGSHRVDTILMQI